MATSRAISDPAVEIARLRLRGAIDVLVDRAVQLTHQISAASSRHRMCAFYVVASRCSFVAGIAIAKANYLEGNVPRNLSIREKSRSSWRTSMSESIPITEASPESVQEPADDSQPGLLADPVVRLMLIALLVLVVLFLATAIGVLVTGITVPTGPRTAGERQLMIAAKSAQGASGEALAPYVNALIAAGNLPAARISLGQARASVSATAPAAALDLAEARLLSADAQYEEAAAMADQAMKNFVKEYEIRVANAGDKKDTVKGAGYAPDYYNAALVRGRALAKIGRSKEAVGMFDLYIVKVPTASDILIDRGNAKAALNDKAGAEKDFREALKYVPYDEEAKAGLKKIGVAQ